MWKFLFRKQNFKIYIQLFCFLSGGCLGEVVNNGETIKLKIMELISFSLMHSQLYMNDEGVF